MGKVVRNQSRSKLSKRKVWLIGGLEKLGIIGKKTNKNKESQLHYHLPHPNKIHSKDRNQIPQNQRKGEKEDDTIYFDVLE